MSPVVSRLGFQYNDGGRAAAGYKGKTGDCVVRAISIALQLPYQQVYDTFNTLGQSERLSKKRKRRSASDTGVFRPTYDRWLKSQGWEFTPTMGIGTGCRVHLRADELPKGRLIVRVSRHIIAVVDGVACDTADHSRAGTRCVYGYYSRKEQL